MLKFTFLTAFLSISLFSFAGQTPETVAPSATSEKENFLSEILLGNWTGKLNGQATTASFDARGTVNLIAPLPLGGMRRYTLDWKFVHINDNLSLEFRDPISKQSTVYTVDRFLINSLVATDKNGNQVILENQRMTTAMPTDLTGTYNAFGAFETGAPAEYTLSLSDNGQFGMTASTDWVKATETGRWLLSEDGKYVLLFSDNSGMVRALPISHNATGQAVLTDKSTLLNDASITADQETVSFSKVVTTATVR